MAKFVLAAGVSHSPLLAIGVEHWERYAAQDLHRRFPLPDGRSLSYDQLVAERGEPYAAQATPQQFLEKAGICETALDRVVDDIVEMAPDLAIVISADDGELFSLANTPAISLYYGAELITLPLGRRERPIGGIRNPPFQDAMARAYAMDRAHHWPGQPEFARHLIGALMERQFDVGALAGLDEPDTHAFGHGLGFVLARLLAERPIPVVPILFNTQRPPNLLRRDRCFAFGSALAEAVTAHSSGLRVALIASGGLSHFLVDEALDRRIISALCQGPRSDLANLPAGTAGAADTGTWVAMGGALGSLTNLWTDYVPIYRTPVGTGIGAAFGVWT